MNSDQLEGKWKQVKGKFKQKYGDLTDNDLTYSEGKFDEFMGILHCVGVVYLVWMEY